MAAGPKSPRRLQSSFKCLTNRCALHHVLSASPSCLHPLQQELAHRIHTLKARGKDAADDVEEGAEAGQPKPNEDEDDEPHDGPAHVALARAVTSLTHGSKFRLISGN